MKRTVLIVAIVALCSAGSAVAQDRSGQTLGSGGRAEDGDQVMGSGGYLGSGNLTADAGGLIGSGTRSEDSGQVIGSGSSVSAEDGGYLIGGGRGGYFGSGLLVQQLRLLDGSSLLVVSWGEGMFVISSEE
jgi:hypothetical protein